MQGFLIIFHCSRVMMIIVHYRTLRQHYPALRAICVAGCKNHEMFPELLPRLSTLSMPDQVLDTLDLLASCLASTPAAMVHWHQLYTSNMTQSAQLIQYLGE